jgi:alkylhydroperoxidase family enzyme
MTRVDGVSASDGGMIVKLAYRFGPKQMRKLTGRAPRHGSGLEPLAVWGYKPKLLMAMGRYNGAVRKPGEVDERIRNLCELRGATMIGCEYCIDLGSQICRNSGLSDKELLALLNYDVSDLFTAAEKAALDFTTAVMRTPVAMTDEIFAAAREHFTVEQLVELTALLTVVNIDRFNAAFGIGAAGFSDGMVCAVPARAFADGANPAVGV